MTSTEEPKTTKKKTSLVKIWAIIIGVVLLIGLSLFVYWKYFYRGLAANPEGRTPIERRLRCIAARELLASKNYGDDPFGGILSWSYAPASWKAVRNSLKFSTRLQASDEALAEQLIKKNCVGGIDPPAYCTYVPPPGTPPLPDATATLVIPEYGRKPGPNERKLACDEAKKYLLNPTGEFRYGKTWLSPTWRANDLTIANLIASRNCEDCAYGGSI